MAFNNNLPHTPSLVTVVKVDVANQTARVLPQAIEGPHRVAGGAVALGPTLPLGPIVPLVLPPTPRPRPAARPPSHRLAPTLALGPMP